MTLQELKLALYHELLLKQNNELTDSEVQIMYWLCRDEEVQAHLDKYLKDKP